MKKLDKQRVFLHVIFWVVITLIYDSFSVFLSNGNFADLKRTLIIDFLFVTPTNILGVYFILYFLIPKYLFKKKYILFGTYSLVFFIVLVFGSIPLEYFGRLKLIGFKKEISFWEFAQARSLISATIMLMIISIAATIKLSKHWINTQKKNQYLLKEKYETELKWKEAELKFLKSQINPHFLFNSLNNLYSLTLEKSDKAPEIVLKISALLDYMLYECNDKYILLSKEIESLHNYIELQQIRFGSESKFNVDIQEDTNSQKIAPLLILPFIENAFKHGLSLNIEDGEIDIKMMVKNNNLILIVKNSYTPSPEQEDEDYVHQGIGLKNVKKRLELQYPNNYDLKINNENGYFIVELVLQLEKKDLNLTLMKNVEK